MNDYRPLPADWLGLRALDLRAQTAKGSAFRAFKKLRAQWQEGVDYCALDHQQHRAQIETLKNTGQSYASSINVVVVSAALGARILQVLKTGSGDDQ